MKNLKGLCYRILILFIIFTSMPCLAKTFYNDCELDESENFNHYAFSDTHRSDLGQLKFNIESDENRKIIFDSKTGSIPLPILDLESGKELSSVYIAQRGLRSKVKFRVFGSCYLVPGATSKNTRVKPLLINLKYKKAILLDFTLPLTGDNPIVPITWEDQEEYGNPHVNAVFHNHKLIIALPSNPTKTTGCNNYNGRSYLYSVSDDGQLQPIDQKQEIEVWDINSIGNQLLLIGDIAPHWQQLRTSASLLVYENNDYRVLSDGLYREFQNISNAFLVATGSSNKIIQKSGAISKVLRSYPNHLEVRLINGPSATTLLTIKGEQVYELDKMMRVYVLNKSGQIIEEVLSKINQLVFLNDGRILIPNYRDFVIYKSQRDPYFNYGLSAYWLTVINLDGTVKRVYAPLYDSWSGSLCEMLYWCVHDDGKPIFEKISDNKNIIVLQDPKNLEVGFDQNKKSLFYHYPRSEMSVSDYIKKPYSFDSENELISKVIYIYENTKENLKFLKKVKEKYGVNAVFVDASIMQNKNIKLSEYGFDPSNTGFTYLNKRNQIINFRVMFHSGTYTVVQDFDDPKWLFGLPRSEHFVNELFAH